MRSLARRPSATPWVLVVDDEPSVGRATARQLAASAGVRAVAVRGGDGAVTALLAAAAPPDAVVLDFHLAGETGVEVLARLRSVGCRAPVALCTSAPEAAARAGAPRDPAPVFPKGPVGLAALAAWCRSIAVSPPSSSSGTRPRAR